MVKTTDAAFAEEIGVETYPALVFFKEGVPNLYEGDLTIEEEVLDWLIEMKVESHIELITRPMLETMVVEVQYLAVFFYKQNCRTCDQIIAELENIDDECDQYGVQMVKLKDPPLAKRLNYSSSCLLHTILLKVWDQDFPCACLLPQRQPSCI